jgi:hypothetical protein
MARKKETTPTATETRPVATTPIQIKGETYELCFDVLELANAERHFRNQGHAVNLMFTLPELTLSGVRDSFPCLVHRSRPELSFEDAQALVDMQSVYPIATAIVQALNAN